MLLLNTSKFLKLLLKADFNVHEVANFSVIFLISLETHENALNAGLVVLSCALVILARFFFFPSDVEEC